VARVSARNRLVLLKRIGGDPNFLMTDKFALLNEPRSPWGNLDALRQKFIALSSEVHPDRVHNRSEKEKVAANQRYSELNAAYNCLREPKDRLQHLLELELGAKPKDIQRIPDGMMEEFFEVGRLCKQVDAFLSEKERVSSPMLKVQLFEQGQEWTDKLNLLQQKINAHRDALIGELQSMSSTWAIDANQSNANRQHSLGRIEEIYRLLSYFARWSEQIQERVVQLSF
jgi:curved DNA-binding protein CbpA